MNSRFATVTPRWFDFAVTVFVAMSIFAPTRALAKTKAAPADTYFDFQATSKCSGCLSFEDFKVPHDFPNVGTAVATKVRFYYAEYDFSSVTMEASPFIELPVVVTDGEVYVPPFTIGGLDHYSSTSYFVKVALVTDHDEILWFTPNDQCDPARQSVQIMP